MVDTYGTGSVAGAPGRVAPKGAFGNGGGPENVRDGSPPGGSPPNTQQGQLGHTPPGQGGVHSVADGSPEGGNPPSSYSTPLEASALQGGPQRIPADRRPENGDGTGQ